MGIQGGHPHRFRDTFAVELLLGGVDIKTGHASLKITEKHYAPWVRERQEKLEQEVGKSWEPKGIIPTTTEEAGVPIERSLSSRDHAKKTLTIH